ncbi:MAG: glycosyltransferase family 4 protein [Rickettsiales bacterium]|nr:glycosyltransferase family 4 protein [Rickettsiales bacterium]
MNYKPPIILQLIPSLKSGGVERGTIDIAKAIKAAGAVPLVASSGGNMVVQLTSAGIEHIQLPLQSKNPLTLWQNSKRIAKLVRERGVDIVHVRSRAPAWSAWYARKRQPFHFMTTFHGTYNIQNNLKRCYNAVMTKGERVIAISHFIADHIQKNYPIDAAKLRIIPRSVDLKLFNRANYSQQRMATLTKEWHMPEDKPLILCPGRITRWKGQDVLIKALAALPHRNFFAVILGDDKGHESFRHDLERLITHYNLEGSIRIAKHTSNIVEAYVLAKMVISTSIEPEAFGRVALEAQAMGRPVIATNHGGSLETVADQITGWLVPPGDVKALSERIEYILNAPDELLEEIGQNAVQNAQRFSLESMCQETLKVYKELAG